MDLDYYSNVFLRFLTFYYVYLPISAIGILPAFFASAVLNEILIEVRKFAFRFLNPNEREGIFKNMTKTSNLYNKKMLIHDAQI